MDRFLHNIIDFNFLATEILSVTIFTFIFPFLIEIDVIKSWYNFDIIKLLEKRNFNSSFFKFISDYNLLLSDTYSLKNKMTMGSECEFSNISNGKDS